MFAILVIKPVKVLSSVVFLIAPLLLIPVPATLIASSTSILLLKVNTDPFAIVVLPAELPSALPFVILNDPYIILTFPVNVLLPLIVKFPAEVPV